MRRLFLAGLVVFSAALFSCSTAYQTYSSDVWGGKKLLGAGEYEQARGDFIKATKAQPSETEAYALAATASYKMKDLEAASRFIQEAAGHDGRSDSYLRILGYKALILLKEGRQREGLETLHGYIAAYQKEYGPENTREVQLLLRDEHLDLSSLERLLDQEIGVYESDMTQFRRSGTGWFAQRYGTPTPSLRN